MLSIILIYSATFAEEGLNEESLHEALDSSSPSSPTYIATSCSPLHHGVSQVAQWEAWKKKKKENTSLCIASFLTQRNTKSFSPLLLSPSRYPCRFWSEGWKLFQDRSHKVANLNYIFYTMYFLAINFLNFNSSVAPVAAISNFYPTRQATTQAT